MIVNSRSGARGFGLRTYHSKACPRGHEGERYVSTGNCVTCAKQYSAEKVASGYYRDHHSANADRYREQNRDAYEPNRGRRILAARKWAKKNPIARRAISISYKHRRRSQEATGMSGTELACWVLQQPKICHWCGVSCESHYHIDHYYPLSKGGAHRAHNLVVACPSCNRRKAARDPQEFARIVARHTVSPDMMQ